MPPRRPASMGPPLISGGRTSISDRFWITFLGFNGASADQRRKGGDPGCRGSDVSASMGPPLISGGRVLSRPQWNVVLRLQWGLR